MTNPRETVKFNIECEMRPRWILIFCAMLKKMQYLGSIGSSREVAIYSDGDRDFNPKFKWDEKVCADSSLAVVKEYKKERDGILYDAG